MDQKTIMRLSKEELIAYSLKTFGMGFAPHIDLHRIQQDVLARLNAVIDTPTVQEADNGLQIEAQKEDEVATPKPEPAPEPAPKGRRKALSFAN